MYMRQSRITLVKKIRKSQIIIKLDLRFVDFMHPIVLQIEMLGVYIFITIFILAAIWLYVGPDNNSKDK